MGKHKVRIWPLRVIALLCALTFLFSAFLTGTYAWQSQQVATNNVYGQRDVQIPVELIKRERLPDGTETDIPIGNTVFYLYREDGTQIGGQYVTDQEGKITLSLPLGNYYFEEVIPSLGYTYDQDPNGDPIRRYPFTVGQDTELVTVLAYNRRLEGSLLIRKIVENTDGSPLTEEQKTLPFQFTVTFSDNGTYDYRIDGGEARSLTSGSSLYLCSGQTAVFHNIPAGVLYHVTETPVEGYLVSGTGHRGNINPEEPSVAQFINRRVMPETGTLVVSKEVRGQDVDPEKEFVFTAQIGDATETFTLKHGQRKVFAGIPLGTPYTITEQEDSAGGYVAAVRVYRGVIAGTETVELPFVNVHNPSPDQPGSLTISKVTRGGDPEPDSVFRFEVVFEGQGAPENCEFSLEAGESHTITDIPHGVTYTVRETDAAGWLPAIDAVSGTIVGHETVRVEFTNLAPEEPGETTKLTVRKELAGDYTQADLERVFHLTLYVDGVATPFTLVANQVREFVVPVGSWYEVTEEDYAEEGFYQYITNGSGIADNSEITVVVTNTYVGIPYTEIRGEKIWELQGATGVVLPEFITIRLWNGDILVEEQNVTPDEDGNWHYHFVVPRYNPDGSEAVYTVTEEPVGNFRPEYDGYNITNTYVSPLAVALPVLTKVVEGENAPLTEFGFVFVGQHGTPMPQGATGYRKDLTLLGPGEVEIGEIVYDKAGVYVYSVYERNLDQENWTCDTALYTITVVVTEENHILTAEWTLEKNGGETDTLVFRNVYEESSHETLVISGQKTWDHGNNPRSAWPESIVVLVYGDGQLVAQREVTEADDWRYSFVLPRFTPEGREIVYTVDEADLGDYRKEIRGYDLHNTYGGGPEDPTEPAPPPTGDGSSPGLWLALMLLSLMGLAVTLLLGRRKLFLPPGRT